MKASMYLNYTSRSLLRGGQRTVLAVFCVAVGVMAIVSLQLAGFMLQSSFTSNIRDTNGGDIAVTARGLPMTESDLEFFSKLKANGTITNYTAVTGNKGFVSATASTFDGFTVDAVDPNHYPIVSPPTFVTPGAGNVSQLLTNQQVIVTQSFLDKYAKKVGDALTFYIKSQTGSGQTLHVKIAGLVSNTGTFAQSGNLLLISLHDYQTIVASTTPSYNTVYITTINQAHTDSTIKSITNQFPLVSTQTVADAKKSLQSSLDTITKFLEIAGLLALLIGGVGIVNTMRVLLSRRKTEIAMLKTTGYRRSDLYLLFGLEAGMLGLIGGIIGATAAIGVSAIVRILMQNLGLNVPFILNPWTIAGGVTIGLVTSLIFGLMPIVQAANIRPLNVIRDLNENQGIGSLLTTTALLIILSVLFCAFAIVILNNDVLLGIEAVYGTFAFLLLLSVFFGLVVFAVSKLPVPEQFNLQQLAWILPGIAASVLVYLVLPVFGVLLFVVSLMGIVIVLLPRPLKVSTKMALRNIGRQSTRTTTTLLALFIGIFTIGLLLVLAQNLQGQLSSAFEKNLKYNIVTTTSEKDTAILQTKLATLPGLKQSRQDVFTQIMPTTINGQPAQQVLPTDKTFQSARSQLSSMEGYNLAKTVPTSKIVKGRNLNASDANTNAIIISDQLTSTGRFQMHLKTGDSITFSSLDHKATLTANVVGIYSSNGLNVDQTGSVLTSAETVIRLSPTATGKTTITYMKIASAQVDSVLKTLGKLIPNATVQNLADIGAYFAQLLNSMLDILVAIASLSVIAGVIIIANAVALAMLERQRELGILKSVGYTSGTILSEVMIENGTIGIVGGLMAMLLVTGILNLLGKFIFNVTFTVSTPITIGLIAGSALLALLTATLVAWSSVRVRPLEVLRYE